MSHRPRRLPPPASRLQSLSRLPPRRHSRPFDVGCSDVPMFDVRLQISPGSPSPRCRTVLAAFGSPPPGSSLSPASRLAASRVPSTLDVLMFQCSMFGCKSRPDHHLHDVAPSSPPSARRLLPPALSRLPARRLSRPFDVGCSDVPMFDVRPQISPGSPSPRCRTVLAAFGLPPPASSLSPASRLAASRVPSTLDVLMFRCSMFRRKSRPGHHLHHVHRPRRLLPPRQPPATGAISTSSSVAAKTGLPWRVTVPRCFPEIPPDNCREAIACRAAVDEGHRAPCPRSPRPAGRAQRETRWTHRSCAPCT